MEYSELCDDVGGMNLKIEFLTNTRVRVFLTPVDMEKYNIDFDLLDGFDDYTQSVIVKLVDEVKKESEFDISKGKLYVEVFPNAGKGCVFYLTLLPIDKALSKQKPKRTTKTFAYKFRSINTLVTCSKGILKNFGASVNKSTLYLVGDTYYLSITPQEKLLSELRLFLDEYGEFFSAGTISLAFLNEHGKVLIRDTAIEKLCFFLS